MAPCKITNTLLCRFSHSRPIYSCPEGEFIGNEIIIVDKKGEMVAHDSTAYPVTVSGFVGDGEGFVRSYFTDTNGTPIAKADEPATGTWGPEPCDPTGTTCPALCDYIATGVSRTELLADGGSVLSMVVDGALEAAPGAVIITIGGVPTVVSSSLVWDATADPTGEDFAAEVEAWLGTLTDASSATVTPVQIGGFLSLEWSIVESSNEFESVTYDGTAGGDTFVRAFDQENCTEELEAKRVTVCGDVQISAKIRVISREIVDVTGTPDAPLTRQIPGGFIHGSMAVLSGDATIDGVSWNAGQTLDLPPMSFGGIDRLYPEHTFIASGRTRFVYYYE